MAEYYFNLPPITQLTIDQQAALNETNAIALSGGPGTGKSVVSLWRHISNHQRGMTSQLLTYTTTLAKYLEMCCKNQNANASNNINSSHSWMTAPSYYQEIVVDEAQDLPRDYYKNLKNYSNTISYGADDAQILYPESSTKQQVLLTIFPQNKNCPLSKNFRSTQRIMQFAKVAFSEAFIPLSTIQGLANNQGDLPIMLISGGSKFDVSNESQDKAIFDIIDTFKADTHNIGILVPWKKQVDYFYEKIAAKHTCTKYHEGMKGCEKIWNIHVTTFKSAKGLEFDTVIIPNFDRLSECKWRLDGDEPSKFHLEKQDFYVAVTRARSNLYLITNNDMTFLNSVTDKQHL
jgi:DNA helicase IV